MGGEPPFASILGHTVQWMVINCTVDKLCSLEHIFSKGKVFTRPRHEGVEGE